MFPRCILSEVCLSLSLAFFQKKKKFACTCTKSSSNFALPPVIPLSKKKKRKNTQCGTDDDDISYRHVRERFCDDKGHMIFHFFASQRFIVDVRYVFCSADLSTKVRLSSQVLPSTWNICMGRLELLSCTYALATIARQPRVICKTPTPSEQTHNSLQQLEQHRFANDHATFTRGTDAVGRVHALVVATDDTRHTTRERR